ncbi:DUF2142 domain-containing protein [Brachybacterium sp. JHP9]|uniref:DUF2142 domain-containing protein n=1 Tax=Brachybacterium equifaecis TaxID=2910770 RepID=A0ABT0QY10_9MICO|nr:DUF2142 domain-containing protein [Brachybacterium equifaecis]
MKISTTRLQAFLLALAGLFGVTFGFALIHPMSGSADEQAHQLYAYAVVSGQAPLSEDRELQAPAWLLKEGPWCWRFDARVPATCATADGTMASAPSEMVTAETTASNYPPLFYVTTGWPLLFLEGHKAAYALRFLTALQFSAIAAAGIAALGRNDRRSGLLRVLAAACLTPTAITAAGGFNPQGLEIAAALLLVASGWPLVSRSANEYSSNLRWAGVVAGSALLILSRPTGPIWAVLLALLLLVGAGSRWSSLIREKAFLVYVGVSAAACAVWLGWRIFTPQTIEPPAGIPENCGVACVSLHMMNTLPNLIPRTIGVTGWDDTVIAWTTAVAGLLILAAVLAAGLDVDRSASRRAILLGILFIPVSAITIERMVIEDAGFMWQARYAMPFILSLIWIAAQSAWEMATSQRVRACLALLSWAALAFQSYALVTYARFCIQRFWWGVESGPIPWDAVPRAARLGLGVVIGTLLLSVALIVASRLRGRTRVLGGDSAPAGSHRVDPAESAR